MTAGRGAVRRFGALLFAFVVIGGAGGCGPAVSTGPATSPGTSPPGAPAGSSPPAISAGPPSVAGTGGEDCPIAGGRIALPLDRVVDLALGPGPGPGADVATFFLGGTGIAAAGDSRAELSMAAPPFSRGGQAIDLVGRRFLEIRFLAVRTRDVSGVAVFRGNRDIESELPAIRQLTVVEEMDGLLAWYVGLDGPGCVSFALDPGGDRVILTVGHARG